MSNSICRVDTCDRTVGNHGAKGMCPLHYVRQKNGIPIEGRPRFDRCQVDGCGNPQRNKTSPFCYPHYMKNYRHGSPTYRHLPPYDDKMGRRFGNLVAVEKVPNGWICKCDCGSETFVTTGSLNRGAATCGDATAHRRGEWASYGAAHSRVKTDRGPAKKYSCIDCNGPAVHWSYNHSDPNELVSAEGMSEGCAYSLDSSSYDPRCASCHKRFDLAHINGTEFIIG